jgi:hypothetical protein
MQVHHSLGARLRARTTRMVVTPSNHDPPTAVSDIANLQAQDLSGPQPSIQHQADERDIPSTP